MSHFRPKAAKRQTEIFDVSFLGIRRAVQTAAKTWAFADARYGVCMWLTVRVMLTIVLSFLQPDGVDSPAGRFRNLEATLRAVSTRKESIKKLTYSLATLTTVARLCFVPNPQLQQRML